VRFIYGHMSIGRQTIPSASEHPTAIDIAWMAGIYEGEGCVQMHGRTPTVTVSQKDPWILFRLQRLVGGSVRHYSYTHQFSNWTINGALARGFLMTIYNFLSPRRRTQATTALLTHPNVEPSRSSPQPLSL
jgi:hypothetical protein